MQFVTFLPKRFNDGTRVKKSLRASVLDEAWREFGGFSVEGPVTGAWVDTDDGKLYLDQSERLTIHCENHRLAEAEAFVRRAGRSLRAEGDVLRGSIPRWRPHSAHLRGARIAG